MSEDSLLERVTAAAEERQLSQNGPDHEWFYQIYLLSRDDCVPILGRVINYDVIPADEVLARKWARELEKPEWMGAMIIR